MILNPGSHRSRCWVMMSWKSNYGQSAYHRHLLAGNITAQMTTLTSFGKLCLHRPNIFKVGRFTHVTCLSSILQKKLMAFTITKKKKKDPATQSYVEFNSLSTCAAEFLIFIVLRVPLKIYNFSNFTWCKWIVHEPYLSPTLGKKWSWSNSDRHTTGNLFSRSSTGIPCTHDALWAAIEDCKITSLSHSGCVTANSANIVSRSQTNKFVKSFFSLYWQVRLTLMSWWSSNWLNPWFVGHFHHKWYHTVDLARPGFHLLR